MTRESLAGLLHRIVASVYWLVMIIVIAVVFGADLVAFFVPLGTTLLAVTFIFGGTVTTMWDNLVLIFAVRPFDVGDRIAIDGVGQCNVRSIYLMTTEVYKPCGEMVIIPNKNVRRCARLCGLHSLPIAHRS